MARPKKVTVVEGNSPIISETVAPPALQLSPEEAQAIMAMRSKLASGDAQGSGSAQQYGLSELAEALMQALNAVKPTEKKTIITRKKRNPWMPTDGSPKILQFKRPMFHHGLEIDPRFTKNETCKLLDQIKPGTYCDKLVRVSKRKNGGYDIDYSIKTAAQRLKIVPYTAGRGFDGLLERIIAERADPKKYRQAGDDDDE
ncbi:MAG: hypothetical protein AB7J46_06405 [Candidatus Altimarinota bacterium]